MKNIKLELCTHEEAEIVDGKLPLSMKTREINFKGLYWRIAWMPTNPSQMRGLILDLLRTIASKMEIKK